MTPAPESVPYERKHGKHGDDRNQPNWLVRCIVAGGIAGAVCWLQPMLYVVCFPLSFLLGYMLSRGGDGNPMFCGVLLLMPAQYMCYAILLSVSATASATSTRARGVVAFHILTSLMGLLVIGWSRWTQGG